MITKSGSARVDRGPDLLRHLLGADDQLALHVTALLGGDLVLDVDPGHPGRLVGADRADHVQRVAVAGVHVGDHRDVHARGDPARVVGHLGHREQAHVGPSEQRGGGAEPGHVHRGEPGLLDQPGSQGVERARRHDRLARVQQRAQPGGPCGAPGQPARHRTRVRGLGTCDCTERG
jgi:hypothetical protein